MTNAKPKFTYGDVVRRRSDGRRLVVEHIGQDGYHFEGGTYALIADQDCYTLVEKASGYFRVATTINGAPLDSHTEHGYEDRSDFRAALRSIVDRFGGRIGQNTGERNGFLQLLFKDIPGGGTEHAWIPLYLLTPCPIPEYAIKHDPTPEELLEQELDEAFGFDCQ
ncbi:MAG: hypothetical protein IJV24_07370 [Prevotella sp.]|nr:hypothetical protein [Prevotella sp.]